MESQRAHTMEQPTAPANGPHATFSSVTAARRSPMPAFFLRTKLLPPRPTPELLSRPRLTTRLENNLANPITLVTANAGSGKTTLVAEFVAQHAAQSVWYQLDHTDADPIVFLGYLVYGLQQTVPDFGAATFAYLNAAPDELAQQPERAVDVLLNEVWEKIERQVIIVLDDYHHLGLETPVHRVLDRLAAYLPDLLHIIIITRDMPPLALARRRSQARLEVIDRDDLLFTDDETQQLFRQMFDLDLSPAQLAEYRARTQGWITALQLVRQLAQRQALAQDPNALKKPDLVEILRQSERDIFDYFAEEVFADETEETQNLLLRIALLERVELETCARLYPSLRCAAVLPALVRRNVFVTVARDERGEEYRLHPLFRGFLNRRLRADIGRTGVAHEHKQCAAYFLSRKAWEAALHHLVTAEEFTAAAQVLAEHGNEWLVSGALTSLATWAAALPSDALAAHPQALLHWAEVMRLRGDYDQARQLLQRAVKLLDADPEGQAAAWHSLAAIARRRGDCNQTFEYLEHAFALTPETSPVRVKCANTRALCLKKMGRWTEAEHEFRLALQAAEANGDEHYKRLISHNLGLPAMLRGDFTAALRWLRRMLHTDSQTPLPQESVAHLNIARCHFYRGELALCTQHLEQALELCQTFTLRSLEGEIFEAYGNLYREQNDAAHAAEFYERALRAYDAAGIDPLQREIFEEQALLRWQQGDLHGARGLLERVKAGREENGDEIGLQVVKLTLCRLALANNATAPANADLPAITAYFHAHQLYYYEAQASLASAWSALADGAENVALVQVRRTLDLAARYDYDYWLRREVVALPQLFGAADIRELLPPDLRELLPPSVAAPVVAAPSVSAPAQVEIVTVPVTDLTIKMLGPVEICRDHATPLPAEAWTTRRARDILCYIAAQRHRRASKDTLIDVFWGEADFAVVDKNFHPTISHIRKALNYQQKLKQNFLLYQDGAYQFAPAFSYYIDTEEFERLVKEGHAARRERDVEHCMKAYEGAIELYRGDFMEGVYDDWAEEQRGYLREQYLRILESLVAAAQRLKDWPRALDLAQQILRQDQFREDLHAVIMRAHAALGNRAAVKERYQALRVLLRKELGVEPAPETQRAYQEALR